MLSFADDAWWDDASCRDADPDLFHGEERDIPARRRRETAAKAVCARCPVRDECLTAALAGGEHGIWGGLTDQERAQLSDGQAVA